MSKEMDIEDKDLRAEAPLLFGIEREETKAPEGYFDGLADELWEHLDAEEATIVPIEAQGGKQWIWLAAASVAILIGLFTILPKPEADGLADAPIDLEQDMDYLLEIEDEILFDVLAELETDSDDIRIDYLLDEGFELEELLN